MHLILRVISSPVIVIEPEIPYAIQHRIDCTLLVAGILYNDRSYVVVGEAVQTLLDHVGQGFIEAVFLDAGVQEDVSGP